MLANRRLLAPLPEIGSSQSRSIACASAPSPAWDLGSLRRSAPPRSTISTDPRSPPSPRAPDSARRSAALSTGAVHPWTRIKPPLPYVPARRLSGIPVRSVASVGVFERLRERPRVQRNSDQVHVIRHQAVTQQRETVQLRVLPQQLQIGEAIGIAGENDLSGIATLRNMMGNIHRDHARKSSHNEKISEVWYLRADGEGQFLIRRSQMGRKELGYVPSVPELIPN